MTEQLKNKVKQAINLIQTTCAGRGVVEVAYSGGKDSDVILNLVKESGIPYTAVYKNTTIDPVGTIKHAKDAGAIIIRPRKTFFDLLSTKGYPNRSRRFCCGELKEYKVLDTSILGIRASESNKRKNKYKEPTQCRIYKKDSKVYQIFPILYWTDEDVLNYIKDRNIQLHPLYYNSDGNIEIKRRLGCCGCPIMSRKKRVDFFKENPKFLRRWCVAAHDFYKNRTLNEYELMFAYLFFPSVKKFKESLYSHLFGKADAKKRLEEIFKVKL